MTAVSLLKRAWRRVRPIYQIAAGEVIAGDHLLVNGHAVAVTSVIDAGEQIQLGLTNGNVLTVRHGDLLRIPA